MAAMLIEADQIRRDVLQVALADKNITTSAFATPEEARDVLAVDRKGYRVILFGTSSFGDSARRDFLHHASYLVDASVRLIDYSLMDMNWSIVDHVVKAHRV